LPGWVKLIRFEPRLAIDFVVYPEGHEAIWSLLPVFNPVAFHRSSLVRGSTAASAARGRRETRQAEPPGRFLCLNAVFGRHPDDALPQNQYTMPLTGTATRR
jgi:hypothetical protein